MEKNETHNDNFTNIHNPSLKTHPPHSPIFKSHRSSKIHDAHYPKCSDAQQTLRPILRSRVAIKYVRETGNDKNS